MAKRRPSGDGMARRREDGRWEGHCVVGCDDKGIPVTKSVLAGTKTKCVAKPAELIRQMKGNNAEARKVTVQGRWGEAMALANEKKPHRVRRAETTAAGIKRSQQPHCVNCYYFLIKNSNNPITAGDATNQGSGKPTDGESPEKIV